MTTDWLEQAPKDAGLSSLSSAATRRREGAQQFAHRVRAWVDTWRCLWCDNDLDPHSSGRFFYCSDTCRQKLLDDQKARILKKRR